MNDDRWIQNSNSQPFQTDTVMHWKASTPQAARNPKIESTVVMVLEPASSSSSAWKVALCVEETGPELRGCVGGCNCTVAFGSPTVAPGSGGVRGLVAVAGATKGLVAGARPGIAPAVFNGIVGAGAPGPPVLSLIVGAAVGRAMGPAVFRGIVGAGAGGAPVAVGTGGRGMPPTVGVGGLGTTGAVEGATGTVGGATGVIDAEGEAGTSLAFSVTRTVSFLRGMLEVCFDGL